ncbi:MAG: hypothetical protein LBP28_01965 [Coriobacteriales bacterium]|nr:hypothetical protein [Coriobacteriales bacterium]
MGVYRINDDGSCTLVESTVEGDRIVFYTNHFSLYAIVELAADTGGAATTGSQGGDGLAALDEAAVPLATTEPGSNFVLLLWLIPIALVLGLGTALIVRRRLGREAAAGSGGGAPGAPA